MLVKLLRVYRGEVETKYGMKKKVAIQIDGDDYKGPDGKLKWLSTFNTKGTDKWAEGMNVNITISEKNGYLNFEPDPLVDIETKLVALEKRVLALEGVKSETLQGPSKDKESLDNEINPEDTPF